MKNNSLQELNMGKMLKDNAVVIVFAVMCVLGFMISGMSLPYVLEQVFTRLGENTFLVLALIIPVLAGMGLNFSMTVGAMGAQMAFFFAANFAQNDIAMFQGLSGLFMTAVIATPIAAFLGWLSGLLLNKTKGQEMITGMILGFFATGLYMLFFLFFIGKIIPIDNTTLILSGGVGVKSTFEIPDRAILNRLLMRPMLVAGTFGAGAMLLYYSAKINKKIIDIKNNKKGLIAYIPFILGVVTMLMYAWSFDLKTKQGNNLYMYLSAGILILSFAVTVLLKLKNKEYKIPLGTTIMAGVMLVILAVIHVANAMTFTNPETAKFVKAMLNIKIPMATYFVIALLCVFNNVIQRTKLGQDIRTVGQSMSVATASGINVNKIRILAIIFSTVFAAWGQILYLQSVGTVQTYAAHENVALYSIAAILVGGASITKATNRQAIVGVILFHTMLIILPDATKLFFNDAQHSEYFRAAMLYGVICVSLIMHAMGGRKKAQSSNRAAVESTAVETSSGGFTSPSSGD